MELKTKESSNKSEQPDEEDLDPCSGFPTTHKAKLSITSIVWSKRPGTSNAFSDSSNPEHDGVRNGDGSSRTTRHWIGLILTIFSAAAFSLNALLCKLLSHLDPFNLGVWTFLLMTLFSGISLVFQRKVSRNDDSSACSRLCPFEGLSGSYSYLFIRLFAGTSALTLFFYAVKYLTVADAIVIDASSPIFVYLMAFLFLGEKFGILPVFTTIVAFCGVVLIARPPLFTSNEMHYDTNNLIGVILSFSAMLCITTTIISLRFLENVHHAVVNFSFGLWGTGHCILVSWICGTFGIPSDPADVFKIVSVSVLFYLGQALITLALKYEEAGPVGLLRTTEVMFIFIWQLVFLGVVPDAYSWYGALLILLGVFLTLSRNWISTLPESSGLRHKCRWLLR